MSRVSSFQGSSLIFTQTTPDTVIYIIFKRIRKTLSAHITSSAYSFRFYSLLKCWPGPAFWKK